MLSFAVEFPVFHSKSKRDFIDSVVHWILDSPHTCLVESDFFGIENRGEFNVRKGNQLVKSISVYYQDASYFGLQNIIFEESIIWTTEIGFSRETFSAWVGVRTSREADSVAVKLPRAKKPIIVRTLLETIGGDHDGELVVSSMPHRFNANDIDIASRLILGDAGCRLPIVYASSDFRGNHGLDTSSLASDLAGMAHVVAEPDRHFSRRLQINVDSENVYGGTLGIYWPDASGRRSYFNPRDFDRKSDLKNAIIDEVRAALMNRRPLYRCTWTAAQEALSRFTYDDLKSSGSQELNKYVESFDKEINAKTEKLIAAEKEIQRLSRELQRTEARSHMSGTLNLKAGSEQELFSGEFADIVIDAIAEALQRSANSSRRQHVLQSIAGSNTRIGRSEVIRNTLKSTLRGYTTMSKEIKSSLEHLGFTITEDGKHFKMVFQDDDRYTCVLPKTGSDHRGGLNAVSDISKKIL